MQDDLDPAILDAHDDLMQNGADKPLARRRRRGGVRPGHLEIGAKAHETITFLFIENRLAFVDGFQLIFESAYLDELVVPSAFEFARNETVVRIHGIILPPCARGLKVLLLQRQFDLPELFSCARCSIAPRAASTPNGFISLTTSAPTPRRHASCRRRCR